MRVSRPSAVLIIFCFALAAGAARAETPGEKLQSVQQNAEQSRAERERFLKEADALGAEIDGLRRDSVSAAETAQQHEAALSALEDRLRSLNAERAAHTAELKQREAQRTGLLMSLVRLARNPPEALALASPDPAAAERSALLLGQAVPHLDREAHALADGLARIASLTAAIAEAEEHHKLERRALDTEQVRIAAMIAKKQDLQQRATKGAEESTQRAARLAAEAANLKELIERLEAERRKREADAEAARVAAAKKAAAEKAAAEKAAADTAAAAALKPDAKPDAPKPTVEAVAPVPPRDPAKPDTIRNFRDARGKYLVPASGRLVKSWGQEDGKGSTAKGMTYETRPGAQIVAPFDGRVLFAGPFRGYGRILIIEHGDGYHSLLAGMERVDGAVGQWLVAGEPVGAMPEGEEKPQLYIELRQNGQPINPLPWLATASEKVSG